MKYPLYLATALATALPLTLYAASHREAPLMTLDPGADITDVYVFVSYDEANLRRELADRKVTLIMNVVPGQEPGSGPNYYAFDDNVLYALHVDNDRDGVEDFSYEFRFTTTVDNPAQFIATLGPVTTLDAAGLSRKQRYSVTEVRNCSLANKSPCRRELFKDLLTVPSNIGPRTTPDYQSLANQGIYTDDKTGIRVFAGQSAETFAIDLGAVFDTLNLRRALPVQSASEDADDTNNPFGNNNFSGFNINTIAIEVPIKRLTVKGQPPDANNGTIGVYASTSRQQQTLRSGSPRVINEGEPLLKGRGPWRQVSRLANPLVNELIIPIGRKDFWNASAPEDEAQFLDEYRNLAVADALQAVFGVPVPAKPREDIVQLLLKYQGQNPDPKVGPFSELLRLDMTVPPTPPEKIKRLGPLAHDAKGKPTPDPAGFPNGRRPNDDVTDLVVRVAGGANYINNFVGDGVGINEKGITAEFPFLPTPFDGRNRRHIDCDEAGANPCN